MDTRPGYPDKKVQYSLHIFTFRGGPYKVKEAKHSSVSYPSSERGGKRKKKAREGEKERKGGGGGSHHVIREDKVMQTLFGHFEFCKRKRRGRNTSNIVLFVSVFVKDFPLCPFTEKVFYKRGQPLYKFKKKMKT